MSGPQNSGLLRFDFANCTNATMFWVDSRAFVPLSASLLHSPNNIIFLPVRSCSMAGFGYKDLFKLVSARPRLNGKFDPNPRVECGFCGFQFYGGPTRQKSHLLGQKGGGVQICTRFESMDPDMFAELQLEAQKQQEQQSQQARKRATSAASSSSSAKQQKLDGMLSKGCKAEVDAKVALLFYAEGIPFEKVGGAAHRLKPHQTLSSSMQARSKYFKEAVEAIGNYGPGYRPPSSELLRTRLLVESAAKLDKELASLDPTIERYGSTITSDGWSDARMRPILNMLQVYADGVKFMDSVDTSGKTKVCAPACFGGARPLF